MHARWHPVRRRLHRGGSPDRRGGQLPAAARRRHRTDEPDRGTSRAVRRMARDACVSGADAGDARRGHRRRVGWRARRGARRWRASRRRSGCRRDGCVFDVCGRRRIGRRSAGGRRRGPCISGSVIHERRRRQRGRAGGGRSRAGALGIDRLRGCSWWWPAAMLWLFRCSRFAAVARVDAITRHMVLARYSLTRRISQRCEPGMMYGAISRWNSAMLGSSRAS